MGRRLTEIGPYYDPFNERVIAEPQNTRFSTLRPARGADAPKFQGLASERGEGDHAPMTPA
jgi:hypothetical protein